MTLITDAQEIVVTVGPLVENAQRFQASVYNDRASNAQELLVNILPLVESSQRLLVTIRNQAYGTAGLERLLAPDAEITFE